MSGGLGGIFKNSGGSVLGKEGGGPVEQDGITAYHGSPHDFEQFDTSKIGTGEGAQAYGHGLYFANSEPVAQTYQGDPEARYQYYSGHMDPKEEAAFHLATQPDARDMDVMMGLAKKYGENIDFDEAQRLAKNAMKVRGHMYEVHINAHQNHLLDWNKTLHEQNEYVKPKLQAALDSRYGKGYFNDHVGKETEFRDVLKNYDDISEEELSDLLSRHGIKGIKYFDQDSKRKGNPNHNYVVFDHNDVHIKRKYEQGGRVGFDDGGSVHDKFLPHNHPQRQQNLGEFMRDSAVKHPDGRPKVVYHNTNRTFKKPIFSTTSEMGAHFGTPAQANDITGHQSIERNELQGYPVYLNIKNPLRLQDRGEFSVDYVAHQLEEMGKIPREHRKELTNFAQQDPETAAQDLQELIRHMGHDGIVYLNRREGVSRAQGKSPDRYNDHSDEQFVHHFPDAEDSYIAFDPTQIKSAIGNNGYYDQNEPDITKAEGGEVDDIPDIKNPVSVFPKPQRMFPEENRPAGGQYLNAKTKEDMTGHKAAQASIGVQPGGRPFFNASADAVEQTGSHGKGNATAKTNLFKQKAGWKWVDAPEDHQDTGTIVSVEHRGHHHYALNAHFPKGVDLARYENSTSEPRLRPTTKGNVTKGDQVGTISVRGKEHPVYNHVIVKADGGDVWDDSLVRRSGEGGQETALDFIQNAPLYKQRMEAQAPQPAPVAAPSTEGKSMPVTAAPPPAIVQPAQPVQQKQEQPQGQVGLYAVGTNDPNPDMTVQSAQRIIESSRAMGINPVFLLPNQAGNTQYAQNSRALQKYLDENSIQYQMPQYGDKDPLHMTPSWASEAAKSYEAPFLAGDSNSVRLGIVGYGAKGDGKTIVHPESGAVLGRVGANSKAVADELERHLKWQMQNRTQRNTGGPVTVSKGQDTAGNFKKEHEKIHGIPVAVEVKEGHDRVKYEPDGSLKFKAKQYADYGAILGTKDADGMNTDVMVGPHKDSDKAYIIDQRKHSTGKFDEHKVMLGFNKRKKAIKAYTKSYADRHGKDRVQDVVKTDIAGLKKWLKRGDLKKSAAKDALINRALEVVSKKT